MREDEFISSGILDKICFCNFDQHKYKNYVNNHYNNNFENDLNVIIANIGIKEDHINSVYIYTNIDNKKQNFTLQLLFAIGNIKTTVFIPIFKYQLLFSNIIEVSLFD